MVTKMVGACPQCNKNMTYVIGEHAKMGYCVRCKQRVVIVIDRVNVYTPKKYQETK